MPCGIAMQAGSGMRSRTPKSIYKHVWIRVHKQSSKQSRDHPDLTVTALDNGFRCTFLEEEGVCIASFGVMGAVMGALIFSF